MFQTILIGYDEPERGGEAIALAQTLRSPQTGTLVLTSVCSPAQGRDQTEELLLVARDALPDKDRVTIRAIASDSAARALSETAEIERADLIVVGASRRSAEGRPLPGTTAERLLADAPCPVIVAPRGYGSRDVRRIGVAHDGSPQADAALRAAESLAVELSAGLTVYCVVEPGVAVPRCDRARSPPPARRGRQRAAGHPARVATSPAGARGWIAGRAYGVIDLLFVGSPAEGPLRLCAAGQRLRRARARRRLPGRRHPAYRGHTAPWLAGRGRAVRIAPADRACGGLRILPAGVT